MSQGNPVQFSPRQRIEIRWPGDDDREDAPVYVFRPLTLDEFCELFELREICRKPRSFDDFKRMRDLIARNLVGWRNQVTVDTDEPIEFDITQFGRTLSFKALLLLSSLLLSGGRLVEDDLKKFASLP